MDKKKYKTPIIMSSDANSIIPLAAIGAAVAGALATAEVVGAAMAGVTAGVAIARQIGDSKHFMTNKRLAPAY